MEQRENKWEMRDLNSPVLIITVNISELMLQLKGRDYRLRTWKLYAICKSHTINIKSQIGYCSSYFGVLWHHRCWCILKDLIHLTIWHVKCVLLSLLLDKNIPNCEYRNCKSQKGERSWRLLILSNQLSFSSLFGA